MISMLRSVCARRMRTAAASTARAAWLREMPAASAAAVTARPSRTRGSRSGMSMLPTLLAPRWIRNPSRSGAAVRTVAGLAEERRAVLEHRVDLPALAVRGTLDPELVLLRVTTRRSALVDRRQTSTGESGLFGVDDVGRLDFDAEVVQCAALAGVLQQHQLQRRVRDR